MTNQILNRITGKTYCLDLGCGPRPQNLFSADMVYGIDLTSSSEYVIACDLAVENIPFNDESFEYVTAVDFLEHLPRLIYTPERRLPFVELMSEVFRVLRPGGMFFSFTPSYPNLAAFSDPTHVNFITDETFTHMFDRKRGWASKYGFRGGFEIISQEWQHPHLRTLMRKPEDESSSP